MNKTSTVKQIEEDDASYAHLPVAFNYQTEEGSIEVVTDPVYRCLADGFYGERMGASYFQEGEIIVLKGRPNDHLQALNRAAGKNFYEWKQALPLDGVSVSIGDFLEASVMLRPREGVPELSHDEYSTALKKLVLKIKAKREGKPELNIPPITAPGGVNRSKLPGLLGVRYTDAERRGPGDTGARPAIHEPAPAQPVRRARPAMNGVPAPAPSQAPQVANT